MDEVRELAEAARAGDAEAYSALVQRFQPMAYAVAYSCLGDHHLAHDLVQEAVIQAFVCLPRLREPAAFPGWFRQIVFRQCTRVLRQARTDCLSLDAGSLGLVAESTPEEIAVRDEIRRQVRRAVATLPRHERAVAALFYGRRYSYREVSASLGIPITTVKKRLHSARQKLRVQLQAILGDEIAPRSSDSVELAAELAAILLTRWWNRLIVRTDGMGQENVYPAAA